MTEKRLLPREQACFRILYPKHRRSYFEVQELQRLKIILGISSDDIGTLQVDNYVERKHGENEDDYEKRALKLIRVRGMPGPTSCRS